MTYGFVGQRRFRGDRGKENVCFVHCMSVLAVIVFVRRVMFVAVVHTTTNVH